MQNQNTLFLETLDNRRDYFYNQYFSKLGSTPYHNRGRWPTFKIALNLFLQKKGSVIVETGCQRQLEDWGSGCSTYLFLDFLQKHPNNGKLYSIDNNKNSIEFLESNFPQNKHLHSILGDSSEVLNSFYMHESRIDLLYLDSYDYPIGELMLRYGIEKNYETYIPIIFDTMSQREILKKHGDLILPCQEHCLNELKAAWPYLGSNSIILLDDNTLPGGGKSRLAKDFLFSHGATMILDYHQSLWIKSSLI